MYIICLLHSEITQHKQDSPVAVCPTLFRPSRKYPLVKKKKKKLPSDFCCDTEESIAYC